MTGPRPAITRRNSARLSRGGAEPVRRLRKSRRSTCLSGSNAAMTGCARAAGASVRSTGKALRKFNADGGQQRRGFVERRAPWLGTAANRATGAPSVIRQHNGGAGFRNEIKQNWRRQTAETRRRGSLLSAMSRGHPLTFQHDAARGHGRDCGAQCSTASAPVGHAAAHSPHPMQPSVSSATDHWLPERTPAGHASRQRPHAMPARRTIKQASDAKVTGSPTLRRQNWCAARISAIVAPI